MNATILIAGGSGFIGSSLKNYFRSMNYFVKILTRNPKNADEFFWDTDKKIIDPKAFDGVNVLINLSGASIAKPWTKKYKKEIVESRLAPLKTLKENLPKNHSLELFISASAIGIYGNRGEEVLTEKSTLGNNFLAKTCLLWEKEFNEMDLPNIRKVQLRISNVMDKKGGMLLPIMKIAKWGILSPPGSGRQIISWVDLLDLCRIVEFIISKKEISGVVNACNNHPISNTELCRSINKHLGIPNLLPKVPAFVLGLVLGARKALVLDGQKVMPEVLNKAGFTFKINSIEQTLKS